MEKEMERHHNENFKTLLLFTIIFILFSVRFSYHKEEINSLYQTFPAIIYFIFINLSFYFIQIVWKLGSFFILSEKTIYKCIIVDIVLIILSIIIG
jgi:hypothetical protein